MNWKNTQLIWRRKIVVFEWRKGRNILAIKKVRPGPGPGVVVQQILEFS